MSSAPQQPERSAIAHTGSIALQEFTDYSEAQKLVDRLSDERFAVEHVRIVGVGIRTVEQVTGRMTKARAALIGAGTGAWLGLLFGLLFGLFSVQTTWLSVLLGSVILGAFWGAVFGFVAHWASRGSRDFSSFKVLEADRYAVMVDAHYFDEASLAASR